MCERLILELNVLDLEFGHIYCESPQKEVQTEFYIKEKGKAWFLTLYPTFLFWFHNMVVWTKLNFEHP